ncbi:CDP-glycerol glycerophosphotransferase family protein (plasmid) [Halorarum halophilum]|uniref:CDP-glycerol glycerophosphotransferase family protein n=1 Tax=Halorarum halophilum TaxID=2743090 RepID=A0A7D5GP16_9EURY|nr:CDP-glycerol glycerophosphotransferase family protein [Halobaculum halophilum]QLG29664.1 CDP-glycerol glycerophosphotransferase family protein [Halobaculum halophilum]
MVAILYTFDRAFMRKTFEAIDRHVDAESAYLALGPDAVGASTAIPEVVRQPDESVDDLVDRLDPDVVVRNHRLRPGEYGFDHERTVVHVRHGASVGRGEVETTLSHLGDVVDVALAPGERWAERYREGFPDDVDIAVVGVPEADRLVESDRPGERRVLYAPTNHNYGGGSYLNTAEDVLDTFADTEYELLFRPHPMDRQEEPGKSVTERCRERIEDLGNVTYDGNETPGESMRAADVLVSDYSGIVTEWLHTDRPLIQLTALDADERAVPPAGYHTDRLDLETVDDLYAHGPPGDVRERRSEFRAELGIPMDGRAGERAAAEVMACTE